MHTNNYVQPKLQQEKHRHAPRYPQAINKDTQPQLQ